MPDDEHTTEEESLPIHERIKRAANLEELTREKYLVRAKGVAKETVELYDRIYASFKNEK